MYKSRREKLMAGLPANSLTVLFSGHAPYSIGDEKYPFKVNRSFYYFTGLDNEGLALVLVNINGKTSEILYIEPYDEVSAKWVGGRIREQEASETSQISDVRSVTDLKEDLSSMITRYGNQYSLTLCGDLAKQELTQVSQTAQLFNQLVSQQPDLKVENIYKNIVELRMCKDEQEIAKLRQAIAVTKAGIETMMSYAHPNIWENELEAYFDFVLKCNQCDHAFSTICASGKNATILHYGSNNQQAKDDEMVLCDLGAAYKYYNADITRCFPLSGKFTERQKEIYSIVLKANKYIASVARPGLTTRQLNNMLLDFYSEELKNTNLLENGKKISDYYWHGVSHMIGLETHDVSLPDLPLKPGCVISDEPGLYLEEEGIGVRIEDDLLITEDGCEVLSSSIMKEIEDIENFMANRK